MDRLSACLVHPHIQARHASPVWEHDQNLPRSGRKSHSRFVSKRIGLASDEPLVNLNLRYYMEPHVRARFWDRFCRKQYVAIHFPIALVEFEAVHDQISPTTTTLESTRPKTSITAVSNPMTPSLTITTRLRCGPANSAASRSTHQFSRSLSDPLMFRAAAWQQKRNTYAGGLQSIQTIFSLWASMVYGWTRPSVRTGSYHVFGKVYADAIC